MNIKDLKNPTIVSKPTLNIKDLQNVKVVNKNNQLDQESAKASWALFPNKTENTNVAQNVFKAIGNTPGSALNLGANLLKMGGSFLLYDNPISKLLNIGQDKSLTGNIGKVITGEIAKATGMQGGNEKAVDASNSFREGLSKQIGTWEGYKQLGEELIKGKIAQGMPEHEAATETLQTLQRYFVNNPFTAGADVAGTLGGGASLLGKGKQMASISSKTAKLVTAPVEDVASLTKAAGTAVKNKATDVLTPMTEGTVGALKGTGKELTDMGVTRFDEYLNQAKIAAKDYHQPTALEIAGGKGEDALNLMQEVIKSASQEKRILVEQLGDTSVGNIVDKALYDFRKGVADRVGAGITSDGELVELKGRSFAISDSADQTILQTAYRKLNDLAQNPTFRRVDDTIDYLQDILYKRNQMTAVPINGKVEGLMKSIVGDLNNQLKEIGGTSYKALNSTISEVKNVFDDLNKALGKEGSKGGSLMKRIFSPTDGGTKELFNKVRAITGIDLVDEATLAKLAMEIVGDSRQSGLLEQMGLLVRPSAGNMIMEAGKWVLKKLQNQESKATNIIKGKAKLNLKTPDAYKSNIKPGLTIEDVSKSDIIGDMKPKNLIQEAKKYKSAEEFVRAQGIKAFHGTTNKFDVFDINKIGSATDSGMYGKGFYFADNAKEATRYARGAGEVKQVKLDLKNPYIINSKADIPKIDVPNMTIDDLKNADKNYSKAFTEYLQNNGYDGVIDNIDPKNKQYIVFSPNQIKTKSELINIWNYANKEKDKIIKYEEILKEIGKTKKQSEITPNDWARYARENGYNSIDFKGLKIGVKEDDISLKKLENVWKEAKKHEDIKTKSQLTDIWNKANKK